MISLFLFDATNRLKQCLIVVCPQMTEWLSCCVLMGFCSHSKTIIYVLYMLYLIEYSIIHCNSGSLVMLNVRTLCTTMGNTLGKERLPGDVAAIAYGGTNIRPGHMLSFFFILYQSNSFFHMIKIRTQINQLFNPLQMRRFITVIGLFINVKYCIGNGVGTWRKVNIC